MSWKCNGGPLVCCALSRRVWRLWKKPRLFRLRAATTLEKPTHGRLWQLCNQPTFWCVGNQGTASTHGLYCAHVCTSRRGPSELNMI